MHGARSFEKQHRSSQRLGHFPPYPSFRDKAKKTLMETATAILAFPASLHAFIDNDYRSQDTSKYNFDLIVACLLHELLHEKAGSEAISPLTCGNSWIQ